MADERNENSGFKVVDRRLFSEEGVRREDAPAREERPTAEPEKARAANAKDRGAKEDRMDEGFAMLVEFLANSAILQLGLGEGPTGEALPVDFQGARAMIDLMGVLQDKTKGNLSPSEGKLLSDVLFELHTRFVEVQKQATAKRR